MSPITHNPNNQEPLKNHIKLLTPPTNTRWGNGINKITAPIILVLLLFSTIPALALQSEEILKAKKLCAERLKSGNGYEKVLTENNTLVVCGKGEKAAWNETTGPEVSTSESGNQFCKPGIPNLAEAMKSQELPQGEIVKFLIRAYMLKLQEGKNTGSLNYEATGALFSQIKEAMAALDWPGKDKDWHWNGLEALDDLYDLASIGKYYGKRYGMQIVSLFADLLSNPDMNESRTVINVFRVALENTLFPYDSVPEPDRPTITESQTLAEMLLKFALEYPDYDVVLLPSEKEKLTAIAPNVIAELERIKEEKELQREIEKAFDKNDN